MMPDPLPLSVQGPRPINRERAGNRHRGTNSIGLSSELQHSLQGSHHLLLAENCPVMMLTTNIAMPILSGCLGSQLKVIF